MYTEYEATFLNVNKDEIRERLKKAGALLLRPEYLQKRVNFHLPKEKRAPDSFVRVRDEGDKITLSLKIFEGDKIENQKELCIKVDSFNETVKFLELIGCESKGYQETKRELWKLDDVEVTIDEWPFLEPFVEIEGKGEEEVKKVSEKLDFDYSKALFCNVTKQYQLKYGVNFDIKMTYNLTFEMKSPFI